MLPSPRPLVGARVRRFSDIGERYALALLPAHLAIQEERVRIQVRLHNARLVLARPDEDQVALLAGDAKAVIERARILDGEQATAAGIPRYRQWRARIEGGAIRAQAVVVALPVHKARVAIQVAGELLRASGVRLRRGAKRAGTPVVPGIADAGRSRLHAIEEVMHEAVVAPDARRGSAPRHRRPRR